jgi:hypothetical protein
MWCIKRHPLQGGVRGPRGTRELAEAGTSGCGTERRGGVAEGLPVLEHVASDVQHDRAPRAACCARRSSAGRPRGGGGAKRPAEHVHWQLGRGPEERNSGGFGIAYIRPRPPLTDKSRIPSEQAEAHAPVRSRTPTKQPSPAPAHDANRRRTQRRRRVSGDRRQKDPPALPELKRFTVLHCLLSKLD